MVDDKTKKAAQALQKQLNISGFYQIKGEEAVKNLQFNQIPQLKVHDAEQCYLDAKKLQDSQLFNVKEMAKIVREAGA